MKKIQMVDLKGQYEKIKKEVDEAVLEVINSCSFINGPEVTLFAEELSSYLGVAHIIPCANGTDALQIALMSSNLKPGDEVITPSFTYIATAEVIALLRLKPVFVDVDPATFLIQPESIKAAITPKTKAIIPVHLYGQCAHMEPIMEIAHANDLLVIEDTAQAIGADYIFRNGSVKKAGSIAHIGCTSFFPSKNLGCYGDGGAIFTNDKQLYDKMRMIANHGQEKRYYHDIVGVNSRLDSMQAAILKIKLRHLDDYVKARTAVADYYDAKFRNSSYFTIPKRAPHSTHSFHQYTLKLNGVDREELQNFLNSRNIPSNIYYPLPAHRQKAFLDFDHGKGDLSNTETLCQQVISLPMHTEMDEEQLNYISESVMNFVEKQKV